MKKISLLFLLILLGISGCVNTPDTTDIQATVESAVKTAVAPYEDQLNNYVTKNDLETSQTEQNQVIQQYVIDQVERVKDELENAKSDNTEAVIVHPEDPAGTDGTVPTAQASSSAPCTNEFTFVSDLTVPDGMTLTPNTTILKSWYVTNSGTCTWNSGYKIIYHSGDEVGRAKEFDILQSGAFVKPGESAIVSAELSAPVKIGSSYSTYWALKSDTGEEFGAGAAKNIYLSSNFRVENQFVVTQNFGNLKCSDNYGYFICGLRQSDGRGVVYYDESPMLESGRWQGNPAIAVRPPAGDNTFVRFEFGPLRMPRLSSFYTNFCCRPDTPTCDTQVRLYIKEAGYPERLILDIREWNDGLMGEWKYILDDIGIFDQDFTYILEVQSNGGADNDDLIFFTNTRLNCP